MTLTRDRNPVRLRREEVGMLLIELAAQVKRPGSGKPVSAALISMVEGGFIPKPWTQQAIADALDSTREALFPGEFA